MLDLLEAFDRLGDLPIHFAGRLGNVSSIQPRYTHICNQKA